MKKAGPEAGFIFPHPQFVYRFVTLPFVIQFGHFCQRRLAAAVIINLRISFRPQPHQNHAVTRHVGLKFPFEFSQVFLPPQIPDVLLAGNAKFGP
jgi:hypothetical protein